MDCSLPGSSIHGILQARILEWVSCSLSRGIFLIQGSEPRSLASQMNSLPSEPLEKPENTGAGSLSLLQGIFLNQQSNRGLLHCRQILYQLSHTPFSSRKSLCSLMLPGFSTHQVHTGACPPLGLHFLYHFFCFS